jgi:hypothetical protein
MILDSFSLDGVGGWNRKDDIASPMANIRVGSVRFGAVASLRWSRLLFVSP